MLNIQVELLHLSLFEVEILPLEGTLKTERIRRRGENLESLRHGQTLNPWGSRSHKARLAKRDSTERNCRRGASCRSKAEEVRFCKEWRIFPETLSPLVPGRVVENCVPSSYGRTLRAKWFPRQSDARFYR